MDITQKQKDEFLQLVIANIMVTCQMKSNQKWLAEELVKNSVLTTMLDDELTYHYSVTRWANETITDAIEHYLKLLETHKEIYKKSLEIDDYYDKQWNDYYENKE